jgi:hypothetical protein
MATRTIYLATFRQSSKQRAHFSIFVPSPEQSDIGTIIHVVGAPMAGYSLEFKRNYSLSTGDQPLDQCVPIGEVSVENIVDWPPGEERKETTSKGNLEVAATKVASPRISQNFLAPVNDVGAAFSCLRFCWLTWYGKDY